MPLLFQGLTEGEYSDVIKMQIYYLSILLQF